ncbi:MAG: anthranilate/aminodeoxychorismate synthase component II [Gammaproteobacteria bacterium]|nr:anthranilate/aminodeoxychorismate synthase component II [Gammaproteobacteria bacterium]
MLLMIDNYDSFTYNLVQYFGELGQDVEVFRNDQITLPDIESMSPDYMVISPGPCSPSEAGISVGAIEAFAGKIPIFGVCLGHQSIGQAFGGNVIHAKQLMHGKTSMINHTGVGVFQDLDNVFEATRYHSLVVERSSMPSCFDITAWADDGEVMGIKHKNLSIEGVQFHPESIMTQNGHRILNNFLLQNRPHD